MLTDDQKRTLLHISRHLLPRYEDDPGNFIERVVTKDKTWVHHFDLVKHSQQTMEATWLTPSKKFKRYIRQAR